MKLAKEFAEKNLVGGAVKECVYNCQGYSSNDPTITIDVYGVSGERASITFSRYDRAVLRDFPGCKTKNHGDDAEAVGNRMPRKWIITWQGQ